MDSIERDRTEALARFIETLRGEMLAWLEETGTKRQDLAAMMGVEPSYVSQVLRPGHPMSESFVQKLSRAVPKFADAALEHFRIRTGLVIDSSADAAVEARRRRSQSAADLRASGDRLMEVMHEFIDQAARKLEEE